MTPSERRVTGALSAIYILRMLGLFLLLPVLALYVEHLPGSTPLLVGLAVGTYGLTQALFGIPFGNASDRFGRKPVITVGLLLFAIGSVVAALAQTASAIVLGRALQGAGAVAAPIMALLADLLRPEQRSKGMAAIGISIGGAYLVSLPLGPVLASGIGVSGIFWLIAVLAMEQPSASMTSLGTVPRQTSLASVMPSPSASRSQASPAPSMSKSAWSELAISRQLSAPSATPSLSSSGSQASPMASPSVSS